MKKIVVVGAGTGGISLAARLSKEIDHLGTITIIDPSEFHFYQPLWTLIGGGVGKKEETKKYVKNLIPSGVAWKKQAVIKINPEQNSLDLDNGEVIQYDILVLAPGLQINWEKIEGFKDAIGKNGVCSNYSYNYVDYTWKFLQELESGKALFTFPNTPVKCGGAPQKIMYLVEDYLRIHGKRKNVQVEFCSAGEKIFGVEKYRTSLEKIIKERDIKTHFQINLERIDSQKNVAYFRDLKTTELIEKEFSFIHVVPPMSAPDFLQDSGLLDQTGWVDVNKHTFNHQKFDNIFALGDCTNIPTAKTGAAIRKQYPVVSENIIKYIKGDTNYNTSYNGYSSCPLVTGYNSLILAEFDYNSRPCETFPFDQSQPRYSMFLLKRYLLPNLYWYGMMKGIL